MHNSSPSADLLSDFLERRTADLRTAARDMQRLARRLDDRLEPLALIASERAADLERAAKAFDAAYCGRISRRRRPVAA